MAHKHSLATKQSQLFKSEPLDSGSYGVLYKAMCDNFPCAGKILRSTLSCILAGIASWQSLFQDQILHMYTLTYFCIIL